MAKVSRRKFLVRGALGTAGVVAVGTYLFRNPIRRQVLAYANSADSPYLGSGMEPVLWFELTEANRIRLYSPKVEMGQGTFTGMAQLAADELELPLSSIEVVHAPSITGNMDSFATGGSTSIASLWQPLRELAATMREMIKTAAAELWEVAVADVVMEETKVSAGEKELTFAALAKQVNQWPEVDTPELKKLSDYKLIGKPLPRVDLEDKVFGVPIFGMDASMPDMVYGTVVRPEYIGATFVSADVSQAASMPGVLKIIQEDDFVGVVANSYLEAENAKQAIKVTWDAPTQLQLQDIEAKMKVGNGNPTLIQKKGDALEEVAVEAEFTTPIAAHAQIEPNGVVAHVIDDGATLFLSTQVVAITQKEVAKRLDLDTEKVNIIPTFLGGGFGRRLHTPHAVQAAVMSKLVGKPVKYFFSRKEEFQHDMFRPPTHHQLKAKLTANGKIESIQHDFSSGDVAIGSALLPGFLNKMLGADVGAIRGGFCQYVAIPNIRTTSWHVELPFATSWWRSLGLLANTFAWESFMDILAEKAGKSPVDFRLEHIKDDAAGIRLRKVIETAAEKAGYTDKVVNGMAMGFAASTDAGTPCAQVVEVSIEKQQIKIHKVTCVLDPGLAVNPDQVKAQCEGAIIMGISASLFEEMTVLDGQLQPTIYGPYQMALMKHAPKEINVTLLQGREVPGPVGEPPLGPIGAALANAVYRLTGKRLNHMPLQKTLNKM
ncbi:molybdopterin cofactor-binding domain-containing protein [Flavobacterium sp. ASW18X]|uniref:xanthine dehydrogenase family protein molybdopterin-binding subunit n=1 Tax=Flavobacterium sp. ASW18X TaxID=2572595 RepID=UPI0010ADE04F|nr:molybdopterin cofactor-binding domain-containing protein [Flavobacterium sp. ASW18X]TKD66980.1 xanthine dehydrogenase family protein molybdopterin-binding subunit [Flavobacterium sp. ASW18X]